MFNLSLSSCEKEIRKQNKTNLTLQKEKRLTYLSFKLSCPPNASIFFAPLPGCKPVVIWSDCFVSKQINLRGDKLHSLTLIFSCQFEHFAVIIFLRSFQFRSVQFQKLWPISDSRFDRENLQNLTLPSLVPRPVRATRVSGGGLEPSTNSPDRI